MKKENKKEKRERERERAKERERGGERKKGFPLLSKIYRDRAIGFCRSKRQSSSTRRELRMGTRIWGFRQTPKGRGFSYLGYF